MLYQHITSLFMLPTCDDNKLYSICKIAVGYSVYDSQLVFRNLIREKLTDESSVVVIVSLHRTSSSVTYVCPLAIVHSADKSFDH